MSFFDVFAGDWKQNLMGVSFFVFYIIYFFAGKPAHHGLKIPEYIKIRIVGPYAVMAIFACRFSLDIGLSAYQFINLKFGNVYFLGSTIAILSIIYSIYFFINTCRMSNFYKRALRSARIYLFATPILSWIVPYIFFKICTLLKGTGYSTELHTAPNTLGPSQGCALFLWPWLLYFLFSSEVKNIWHAVDNFNVATDSPRD